MDGAFAPRVRRFDGLSGRGLWYRLAAMNINAACSSAPFDGWRYHFRPSGKRVTGFSVAQGLPANPVPLPRPLRGGTMGAGQWCQVEFMAAEKRKPYKRALPGGKQANRPGGRWKCAPIPLWGLPPEGKFALRSASELISISRYRDAKISPSGGDVAAGDRRGAFPSGEARLYGFHFAKRNYKIHCRASRHHNPQPEGLSNLRTLRPTAGQTSEPI